MTDIPKTTKLEELYSRYQAQRAEVQRIAKERYTISDMIAKFTESRGEMDKALVKAKRALQQTADKLPGLIGSDSAGVLGKRLEEPEPAPEADVPAPPAEQAQP